MRAQRPRLAAAIVLAASAFACTIDRSTAPVSVPAAASDVYGRPWLPGSQFFRDTTITTIVVDPTMTGSYSFGMHRLWVRAGGVCSLTSSYGIGTWDLPCVPATSVIVVTAKSWYDGAGQAHVDFSPQLRFVPSDSAASAQLFLYDWPGALDPTSQLEYCNDSGCVNEALTDTSLITHRDSATGFVYRRIKHFSGYEVAAGYSDSTSSAGTTATTGTTP